MLKIFLLVEPCKATLTKVVNRNEGLAVGILSSYFDDEILTVYSPSVQSLPHFLNNRLLLLDCFLTLCYQMPKMVGYFLFNRVAKENFGLSSEIPPYVLITPTKITMIH